MFVYARITNKKVHKLQARSRSANICHLPTQPESMQLLRGKGLRSLILEQMLSEKSQNVPKQMKSNKFTIDQKRGDSHAFPCQHIRAQPAHLDIPTALRCAPHLPTKFLFSVSLPTAFEVTWLSFKNEANKPKFFTIMQWQMQQKGASYLFTPFPALWGEHSSCACTDRVPLEGPYAQPRLLEIFKSESSFLKPVFCVITHTAQVYACTGIGLSY